MIKLPDNLIEYLESRLSNLTIKSYKYGGFLTHSYITFMSIKFVSLTILILLKMKLVLLIENLRAKSTLVVQMLLSTH